MIKRSRFFELATLEQPTDAFDKDVLVDSNSVTWTPDATTVTVRFPHSVENSHYYVIWSKNSALAGDVHRSKAVTLPEGAVLGTILEKQIFGLTPETKWSFKLVSNPYLLRGEQ